MNSSLGDYDDLAPVYNSLYLFEQLSKLKLVKNELRVRVDDKVLDLGCGTGLSARVFNCNLFGLDKSRGMVSVAKQNFPNFDWRVGVAENIPFPDNFFDKLISITAIHNFKDVQKAVAEIKRVVKHSSNVNVVISVLRRSRRADEIRLIIEKNFKVDKVVLESKDIIYFLIN